MSRTPFLVGTLEQPTIVVRTGQDQQNPHIGLLTIDEWTVECAVGRNGLVEPQLKREGDGKTPRGRYPLRDGFYDPAVFGDEPRSFDFHACSRPNFSGTRGCVVVAQEHLMELARRVRPGMVIDIASVDGAQMTLEPRVTTLPTAIETVTFHGLKPGPRLIVTGSIHGNEPYGPCAITCLIHEFRSGQRKPGMRHGDLCASCEWTCLS